MGRPARSGCATPFWHSCPWGLAPERLCVPWGATAMQSGRHFSPLLSLLEANCEYNGKFHAVQKTPSHKANIYRWKVFILSSAWAGQVGLHSHTRKQNPANYCVQDVRERKQGSKCGGQRPPCENPIYICHPVHSSVQVLVCVTCMSWLVVPSSERIPPFQLHRFCVFNGFKDACANGLTLTWGTR